MMPKHWQLTGMVTGMFSVLSDDAMNTWGWRVPFLLAGPLGLIGRYIRVHLEDSPAYQEMRAEMPQEQKAASWSEPLRLLLRQRLLLRRRQPQPQRWT